MYHNVSNKWWDRLQFIPDADSYFLGLKPFSSYLQFIPHTTATPQIAALLSNTIHICITTDENHWRWEANDCPAIYW